jgi:hypothetical protein
MYKRFGATISDVKANHLVYISHPGAIAEVTVRAARAVGENRTKLR